MKQDTARRMGAILGLTLGIVLMISLGFAGILPGAIFGAGGCVIGAITAEKLHARNADRN